MDKKTKNMCVSAIIAAFYVLLTGVSAALHLDKGIFQVRLSEMLTVLPIITPAAIPGLFVGCLFSGIFFGAMPMDTIFGSLTTLIAAIITYLMPKKRPYLAPIPPIILNSAVVPFILIYAYGLKGAIPYFSFTVFIGEAISCGALGMLLYKSIPNSLRESLR